MALRSLGSSLVAKVAPGSPLRETTQGRIEKPNIPGKGDVGSIQRQAIEEPTLRPIPAGSERIVRATPTAESVAGVAPTVPDVDLMASMAPGAAIRPGAEGQALFQGGVAPGPEAAPIAASQATRGGRTARSVSTPGVAEPVYSGGQVAGASTEQRAPMNVQRESFLPSLFGVVSGRAAAEGEQPQVQSRGFGSTGAEIRSNAPTGGQGSTLTFTPTAGQFVKGFTGKVIQNVGQALGNILPERGVSERLQAYGGAPGPAIVGQGSISSALRSIAQPVKQIASNVRSAASNAFSNLRSLLGKKR